MLDLGIDLNAWPWIWLIVAIVFFIVELTVLAGSFVLLPFGVSAFAASIAGFYDASVEVQWGIFLVGGAALWVLAFKMARRYIKDDLPLGVGADRLVGLTGIVTAAIDPDDTARKGRVTVGGEVWGALTHDDHVVAEGVRVKVVGVQGTRVVVEPINLSSQQNQETQ